MKSLFLVQLLCIIISINCSLHWKSCGLDDDGWIPTSVTSDVAPALNAIMNVKLCGEVKDNIFVGSYIYSSRLDRSLLVQSKQTLKEQELFQGDQFCFEQKLHIPVIYIERFQSEFELQDINQISLGCIKVWTKDE